MNYSRFLLSISFLILFVTVFEPKDLSGQKTSSGNAKEINVTSKYLADTSIIPNPERGWFIFPELKPNHPRNENNWATDSLLKSYFSKGYRLAKHVTRIPTNNGPIPQDYLDRLQTEMDLFRTNGLKVFFRFNYNWNQEFNG